MTTTSTGIHSGPQRGALPERAFWQRLLYAAALAWIVPVTLALGLYVGLPFLAPVFMELGLTGPAKAIYLIYSGLCHQLPQRSYFLFGRQFTYSLAEIAQAQGPAAWQSTLNPFVLRQFIGNPEMGWKVAWSDRMVSMFASPLLFGLIWWLLRKRLPRLPWWGLVLFLLPMALDGTTHLLSDLAGIGMAAGTAFRDSNAWLAALTRGAFAPAFYAGDAWGSINSLLRLVTGVLFGAGIVWFGYPYLDEAFQGCAARLAWKWRLSETR